MTKTRVGKTVKRETIGPGVFERGQNRAVIVTVDFPDVLGFRLKGTRRTHFLTAESCYWIAAKATALADKKAKADAKKAARQARS